MRIFTTTHIITINPDNSVTVTRTDGSGKMTYHGAVVRFLKRDERRSPIPRKGLTAIIVFQGDIIRHNAGAFVRKVE